MRQVTGGSFGSIMKLGFHTMKLSFGRRGSSAESAPTADPMRNVLLMWLSQLMVMSGFDAAMPFVPQLFRENLNIVDTSERGVYVALFNFVGALAYAVFCPVWGTLSDRFGVKIMLLRGTFLTASFFPLMGYTDHAWVLIALRGITAACAGTTAAANILLVKTVPENRQGFSLGFVGTAYWSGSVLGQVIGGFIVDKWGFLVTFWMCGILYFLAGVCCLFAVDAPRAPAAASIRTGHKRVLPRFTRGAWIMLLLMCFYSLVRRFEIPYISMLVEIITGPEKAAFWTGIIGAMTCVGAVLSGVVIGYLADRLPPGAILLPTLILTAVLMVVSARTDNLMVLGASRTLTFFFAGSLYPILQKRLAAITPPHKRGMVFGWSSTFANTGIMFSTMLSGWTIYVFGTRGVFYATAALTLVLIPATLWGMKAALDRSSWPRRNQPETK